MSQEVQTHVLRRYTLIKKLGSGAYGHVWKVADNKDSKVMALKKIFDAFQHSTDAQRTFREIIFLHQLNHPNIIKLTNVLRAENDQDLYLVFQFMEADLHNAIGQKILKDIHQRFVLYQILKGVKFMHSAQIIHRDLKPSNILINSDCNIKICDFGLARSLTAEKGHSDMILTEQVATRWYRAPQILLGSHTYDKSADIWSIGCILAEMIIGRPFFSGNSTLNQLEKILNFTGRPKKEDIEALNSQVAVTLIDSVQDIKKRSINDFFRPDTPSDAIDLIVKMLQFNPKDRPTVNQLLCHPYLAKFRNASQQIDSKKIIYPPISDNKKLTMKQYRNLIYDRINKLYSNPNNAKENRVSDHESGKDRSIQYRSGSSKSEHKEQKQKIIKEFRQQQNYAPQYRSITTSPSYNQTHSVSVAQQVNYLKPANYPSFYQKENAQKHPQYQHSNSTNSIKTKVSSINHNVYQNIESQQTKPKPTIKQIVEYRQQHPLTKTKMRTEGSYNQNAFIPPGKPYKPVNITPGYTPIYKENKDWMPSKF